MHPQRQRPCPGLRRPSPSSYRALYAGITNADGKEDLEEEREREKKTLTRGI